MKYYQDAFDENGRDKYQDAYLRRKPKIVKCIDWFHAATMKEYDVVQKD